MGNIQFNKLKEYWFYARQNWKVRRRLQKKSTAIKLNGDFYLLVEKNQQSLTLWKLRGLIKLNAMVDMMVIWRADIYSHGPVQMTPGIYRAILARHALMCATMHLTGPGHFLSSASEWVLQTA